jgi:3-oxocholest-4-en-26-oate---CoA ligase
MQLDYATVVEVMADGLQEAPCLYYGDKVVSWREFEDHAARLAGCLAGYGIGRNTKVGLFLYNCCEYMEAFAATFKNRGIPININYRYVGDELVYLLNDCEAEALIFHSSLLDRVEDIRGKLPNLKALICVRDDGADLPEGVLDYDDVIRTTAPAPRIERSPDDSLMMYTGGTTGMPKGVEYRISDLLVQLLEVGPMFFGIKKGDTLDEVVSLAVERYQNKQSFVSLPASPLMHTAGILNSGILVQLLGGALVILQSRSFDPRELWRVVEHRQVNHMVVVGDTFVKPMLQILDEDKAQGIEYDLSSLKVIVSSGVIFSQESKLKLLELGDMLILDAAGATEGGMAAQVCTRKMPPTDTAKFMALPTTEIFDEDYQVVPRGSGIVGYIGMGGTLPRGYYTDEAKTAKTFRIIDGKRFGFTGDMGSIDEDGTLHFKGRGSGCINTGGEKVYPEEVEEAVKRHPKVLDCLVVGVPDDRFGEKVSAVISLRGTLENPQADLMEFCSSHLARYKLPRLVKVADKVQRGPNGKADYKWAKAYMLDN